MLIKTMMRLLTISLLGCQSGYAQEQVFAFFEYDLKDGMSDRFVDGYAKDLEWHASQDDDWSWVGWFVTTGERRGRFIDATPDHAWGDFDHWKVDRRRKRPTQRHSLGFVRRKRVRQLPDSARRIQPGR